MMMAILLLLLGLSDPSLRAEMQADGSIRAFIKGAERPLSVQSYRLEDAFGKEVSIAKALPNGSSDILLIPEKEIDRRRNFRLHLPALKLSTWVSHDGWFRTLSSAKELGANISPDSTATIFRLFAPRAEAVKLYLYRNHDDKEAYQRIEMSVDQNGVWEASLAQNLKGAWYDFTVHGAVEPGNHFFETTRKHVSDPYARVQFDSWGRSRVWPKTIPATPLKKGIPKANDIIAYEVHAVDFTDLLPVADSLKGRIPAMTVPGLRNTHGHPIGFDHLVDLGINVVHLLPMQEFLHYPDSTWKRTFGNDPRMKELGIHEENYQWGYRTTHAFAIESKYRSKGTEPGIEREEFRNLVQAFHDKDIAVIVDLVFNHTGENMEKQMHFFNFNGIDKLYYYRTKDLEHNGVFGNETKSEDRPMVQRWIIDQCLMLIKEFGVDGFRIDLGGLTDRQTLLALREAVGPDIIIYGEPWISSNDPNYNANPDWSWYKANAPIMYFQDDARNAFKGPVSDPKDKKTDRGYAGGDASQRDRVMKALTNQWPEESDPSKAINYLDIHDNWTLADQFATRDFDGRFGVDEMEYRIAVTLLFTSLGPIVLHGGSEFMRSKGLAGKQSYTKDLDGITLYFHGAGDTYNLRTPNHFVWENIGKPNRADSSSSYLEMLAYWKGLIALRKSDLGEVFRTNNLTQSHYSFYTSQNESVLGYTIQNKLGVFVNISDKHYTLSTSDFPQKIRLIGDGRDVSYTVKPANHLQAKPLQSIPAKTALIFIVE